VAYVLALGLGLESQVLGLVLIYVGQQKLSVTNTDRCTDAAAKKVLPTSTKTVIPMYCVMHSLTKYRVDRVGCILPRGLLV